MPESFKIATLLPDCAIRARREALPFRVVPKDENVSLYNIVSMDNVYRSMFRVYDVYVVYKEVLQCYR